MAKSKQNFICQACGSVHGLWMGQCSGCHEWNTIIAEQKNWQPPLSSKQSKDPKHHRKIIAEEVFPLGTSDDIDIPLDHRISSQISEFDRVMGGGVVQGSVSLIGGDPGIGKSTLLLQAVAGFAQSTRCLYVSGEESINQVRLRAQRLGLNLTTAELSSSTDLLRIIKLLEQHDGPKICIIDSIQTMGHQEIDSAAGSVTQLRSCTQELVRLAKGYGVSIIIVGHVTKDGQIAGPRTIEHMVDTVLYFEGERTHPFRLLRGVKNRFGPTDEIGVFDMTGQGLAQVENPSQMFLGDREEGISGAVVFAGLEGSRPLLVEIQALVAPSPFSSPKRTAVGWDSNRLAMILAVLETRGDYAFQGNDVYLNIAGGLKIQEPAADLAVAAALVSSLLNRPLPEGLVAFGEIGLGGEVRSVPQPRLRIREGIKLGFKNILGPKKNLTDKKLLSQEDMEKELEQCHLTPLRTIDGLHELFQ